MVVEKSMHISRTADSTEIYFFFWPHHPALIHMYGENVEDRCRDEAIPGTTPLVAIALIDIAVNIVWKEETGTQAAVFRELSFSASSCLPADTPTLTQQQQMKTMQRACSTPAVPTTQVRRRNRMTPKMFCRQGR